MELLNKRGDSWRKTTEMQTKEDTDAMNLCEFKKNRFGKYILSKSKSSGDEKKTPMKKK